MAERTHRYTTEVRWAGRTMDESWSYASYSRAYTTRVPGKPDLPGSADPAFRGDPHVHNPEDLFLSSISSCHMLSYLALCARRKVEVISYTDEAAGEMTLDADGTGRFTLVILHPTVTVAADADAALAESLHAEAHEQCFIANSCAVPIHCRPDIVTQVGLATEDT